MVSGTFWKSRKFLISKVLPNIWRSSEVLWALRVARIIVLIFIFPNVGAKLAKFQHLESIKAKKTAPYGAVREVHCAQSLYPSRKAIREGYLLQRQKTEGNEETSKWVGGRKGFFRGFHDRVVT